MAAQRPSEEGEKESFRRGDRQGEFYAKLQMTYPLKDLRSRDVPIEEWTWVSCDCRLTVWFHHRGGVWRAFDDLLWHKDRAY
jgi:hypothetical protein